MTKTKDIFKPRQHNIEWVSSDFQDWFGEMEVEETVDTAPLTFKKLERDMLDKEILEEWKPAEVTLADVLVTMKTNGNMLKDGWANLFYVKDITGELRTVYVGWRSGSRGWLVSAYSVSDRIWWGAGSQVFSRNWLSETKTLDTLTPSTLDTLLEARVAKLEEQMNKLKNI